MATKEVKEKETFETLKAEKTRRVKIPTLPGKDAPTTIEGAINGVFFKYKRGEYVDIPVDVADMLEESGNL